jgi:phage/plasmid-associated DNA primase
MSNTSSAGTPHGGSQGPAGSTAQNSATGSQQASNGQANGAATAAAAGIGHNSNGNQNDLRDFVVAGEILLEKIRRNGEDLLIVADEKGEEHVWRYRDGLWSIWLKPVPRLEAEIEALLQEAKLRWSSTSKFITEARKYIERCPSVRTNAKIVWDDHGKVPTRSGLIDPVTLQIEPLRKEHYATWVIDVSYDANAECPILLDLFDDYFGELDDEQYEKSIMLLQDFAGTMLVDRLPKALKVALVIWGLSDTGKSTLMRALWRMLVASEKEVISVTFAELEKDPHCMEEFIRRRPWVLDEAFNNGVWHYSDKVKVILSRGSARINPKGTSALTRAICAPTFWGTNYEPAFKENTEAMINRMKILRLTRIFDKENPVGVAVKARAINPAWEPDDLIHDREKAGVLNWMLAGLQRLMARGHFIDTAAGEAALDVVRRESNKVSGFIHDCVGYDPHAMMSAADFHAGFTGWREAHHGEGKVDFSPTQVGRDLSALTLPRLLQNKDVFKEEGGKRYYLGIVFNSEGRAHFDTYRRSNRRSSVMSKWMSTVSEDVRKDIPDKWKDRPEVVLLEKWPADEN